MSQIQNFGMGVIPPAGPVLTLTGDAGGAVGPNGGGTIFILGEDNAAASGFASIEGNPGTFTLSVIPLQDTVTTLNAVQTFFPIATFPLPVNTAVVMSANVIGNRDDYSAACGGYCTGVVRRAGGAAVFVGQSPLASGDAVGFATFGIGINGNSIGVFVQGVAAQTWNWTCTFNYYVQLL